MALTRQEGLVNQGTMIQALVKVVEERVPAVAAVADSPASPPGRQWWRP